MRTVQEHLATAAFRGQPEYRKSSRALHEFCPRRQARIGIHPRPTPGTVLRPLRTSLMRGTEHSKCLPGITTPQYDGRRHELSPAEWCTGAGVSVQN